MRRIVPTLGFSSALALNAYSFASTKKKGGRTRATSPKKPAQKSAPYRRALQSIPTVSLSADGKGLGFDFSSQEQQVAPVEVPSQWVEDVHAEGFTEHTTQRLKVPGDLGFTLLGAEWVSAKPKKADPVLRVRISKEGGNNESTVSVPATAVAKLHPSVGKMSLTQQLLNCGVKKELWTADSPGFSASSPSIQSKYFEPVKGQSRLALPHEAVVESYFSNPEQNRPKVLQSLEKYGFCLVCDKAMAANAAKGLAHGSAAGREAAVKQRAAGQEKLLLSIFRVLRNTHYGAYSTWRANVAAAAKREAVGAVDKARSQGKRICGDDLHVDGAYDNNWLDFHTDSTYFREPPKIQCFGNLFHTPMTIGGYTTLCDGFAIAEHIKDVDPEAFRMLSTVPIMGDFVKEDQHLIAARTPFEIDQETGNLKRFSFNNADRTSLRLCPELPDRSALEKMYSAYNLLHRTVHSPRFQTQFLLKPGCICCFDNHRATHGRTEFTGPRVMGGSYIGYDDYYSSLLSTSRM